MKGKNWGFKWVLVGGMVGFLLFLGLGWLVESKLLLSISMWLLGLSLISGFLWFTEASADSLREYGLGEGVANLYGEDRAKFMFGENYKRNQDDK
ncbi:hypothetical protein [Aliiroseovarius sediminis]|uniref:hypothetical protein n=1 Tax=Aliiroseovarius sediminis TaxID=2925839 RepID=UPI001F5AFE6A|nr:hypothetical protein [Aliiroseovarius sediminis]MCI2394312.1 hypothetical protein [Aliiroseovarius sediminis]